MTFYSKDLTLTLTSTPRKKYSDKTQLKFGSLFTDHMLQVSWSKLNGWSHPEIVPYHNLSIDPAASCFHYGTECFEGMKVFSTSEGVFNLFRPNLNLERLLRTSTRLGLPTFDPDEFLSCVEQLILVDKEWMPEGKGYSLYIRPCFISTYPHVGVSAPENALLYVILSPVGPYFKGGFKAIKLETSGKYIRAWPGGMGSYKFSGNYAPGIVPQIEAQQNGFDQILWLHNNCCTEVGTMNFFVVWVNKNNETEIVTAPLDDKILPGVTRTSVIEIAKKLGYKVNEREYTIDEVFQASKENRLLEAFGTGTACVITPVKAINHLGKEIDIPLDKNDTKVQMGPIALRLYNALTDIQYGIVKSEWTVEVK
ncbi:branched-chain-amino-acid aminotransferase, putative [Entamoeba invadens IP1]|uniref:Branched-chain-amino-acid aminotransferase n=1 Tax=Entamoeba invadens IP1 TaxID=370355 RepID=A0A0A1U661_ENTIV|nr:branched-chain-amino-acid aminotransferase, putative [Entamoeba invadens IP1]ELP87326.1 branched-chain-amino-acid aminotransferase, putative [Entamoeba invadens IP1]|eukprot:XP_004254097.1 branched-chain-amino-acid aminotransferase, putative [Entamoeba invadens IP1]